MLHCAWVEEAAEKISQPPGSKKDPLQSTQQRDGRAGREGMKAASGGSCQAGKRHNISPAVGGKQEEAAKTSSLLSLLAH